MKNVLKELLIKKMVSSFTDSYDYVNKRILSFAEENQQIIRILDIGCADLITTRKYLKGLKKYKLYAFDYFDFVDDKTVVYTKLNLEDEAFPYNDNYFDIIIAGQVIEHVLNKDHLIEESYRTLKKGGLFICTTENIASFDNIISLIFGQEPISQHTGSKLNTQSFLSPHFMEKVDSDFGNKYYHKNVCSYYGLGRLMKINKFINYETFSMGNINRLFEKIFKIYNRILIIYAVK